MFSFPLGYPIQNPESNPETREAAVNLPAQAIALARKQAQMMKFEKIVREVLKEEG